MIEWLQRISRRLTGSKQEHVRVTDSIVPNSDRLGKTPVYFNSLSMVTKTPLNASVGDRDFIEVDYQGKPLWVLFRCPCGCGKVISLSLQNIHNPSWIVKKSRSGRPTLYPSVWQNKGCYSHFWIEDGRVYWCKNTGIEPWIAEPVYYSKPR